LYETYFVFALVWAYGSALFHDGATDYRAEFSKWFMNEFKSVKFPPGLSVFDVWVDPMSSEFTSWNDKVPKFELDSDVPLQACLVHNSETIRMKFFLDILVDTRFPVMLIGLAGSGKTLLINEKLMHLNENFMVANVPFNFYYSGEMTQKILEKPLEKKAGKNYGPPGNKKLIYFLDDMNMPEVDTYGTVGPHTIIRQHLDYGHWYCRNKLTQKDIHNCQYVACMNPTAGSFTINPRLQRHFATFAVVFPSAESLFTIYNAILGDHLENPGNKFPFLVKKLCTNVVNATLALHAKVSQVFSPTAIKFHYIFNLRDLTNVFQGMLFSTNECIQTPTDLVRLWAHESMRVYRDKLADGKDLETFDKAQKDILKKSFDDIPEQEVLINPLIYCHFARGIGEPKYMPIQNWEALNKILTDALKGYNELNAAMDLVLFEDAMMHICKINRILESPRGNALLVGVGGSGKQSLSRLAAYISSMEVFQVTLRKGYGIPDLKNDLANLYQKTGLKNLGTVFLMSDAQVADEKFLVLINNLLASGEIPDLFSDDEVENIITMVRNEVKGAGIPDTRENCWKFFIDRVRRQLKVVLCFSPVGTTLRVRGRKFPAIINCTCIDWFHEWPEEALISVSQRFLNMEESVPTEIRKSISQFMAYVHQSVSDMSKLYQMNDKRYNYTTPKSFLELINLYVKILSSKNYELNAKISRLENGLEKLRVTGAEVDKLKSQLALQEVELAKKNAEADHLIEVVGVETEKVTQEKLFADEEKIKVDQINIEVSKKQIDCAADLKKAEPALLAAQEALNTLNKANLTELKSFGSPPPAVLMVSGAVMVLIQGQCGKVPKDRSWAKVKVMMAKVDQFLDNLVNYEKENIHPNVLLAIEPYTKDKEFEPEFIRTKSAAAAGLCSWVINIIKFYEVYCDVEPKRKALEDANKQLQDAKTKLESIILKVAELEETLQTLTDQYKAAIDAKVKCQQEADATSATISLANRLVGGLASEKIRWGDSVSQLKEQAKMLPGDVLLVASFISYLGCFTKQYRVELLEKKWLPYLKKVAKPIPMSLGYAGANVLSLLTDDAIIAGWNNEGLPSDAMSTENATILTNSIKWPLLIDPQLQGILWIKNKYPKLVVIRLGQKNYMETVEKAVSTGCVMLLENLGEDVDAVLDPLLGRMLIKKGKAIKLGDKEIEYNQNFQLFLHTKLANPHYKPELQAQTTLINFTVTRTGLEDQLLAEVVKADRPDLEDQKAELTRQQNEYKISLKELEDDLLMRLSSAGDDILSDSALVENLESTKKTAAEIEIKVAEAKKTSFEIDKARELYRPAAARASVLYFILNDLNKINPMYQFSLKAFSVVFDEAIQRAVMDDDVTIRVANLTDSISFQVFQYTTRGLFECDKLIFTAQMAFQILLMNQEINPVELDFLLRFPTMPNITTPVDFISNVGWGAIKSLSAMEEFRNLDRDIENNAKRWRKFVEAEAPEKEKFPQEWKKKDALQRLCMMRALRPDRMTYAVQGFVEENLGARYISNKSVPFAESFQESGPSTPIFFILSPGVDPLKDVEILGRKLGYTAADKNFLNISLGQGQEIVAEEAMERAYEKGHWVVLQNVHLVKMWLPSLEKKIEEQSEGAHESYRLFLSADPAPNPASHIIPQSILETSIKITNEPPTGVHANLHKALDNFTQETLEMCSKEAEFKSILFSLCYFHAVVAERRKFGPQGWNKAYPFNTGDLIISMNVLFNYLEANNRVPWEDLRYLFGEIMYGGHITDDWDRRLCKVIVLNKLLLKFYFF
jgi:dynein heavy chain